MDACTYFLGTNNKSQPESIHIKGSVEHIPTESIYSHTHTQLDNHLFEKMTHVLAYI